MKRKSIWRTLIVMRSLRGSAERLACNLEKIGAVSRRFGRMLMLGGDQIPTDDLFGHPLRNLCSQQKNPSLNMHACVRWHHNRPYLNLHCALISRPLLSVNSVTCGKYSWPETACRYSLSAHIVFTLLPFVPIQFILIHISAQSVMNPFTEFSFTTPILYLSSQHSSLAINCLSAASQWPLSICSADDRKKEEKYIAD